MYMNIIFITGNGGKEVLAALPSVIANTIVNTKQNYRN